MLMKHIAFIMDGNGRWATRKGLSRLDGHTKGLEVAKIIIKECIRREIPYATFYALSVQNLFRNKKELTHLYDMTKALIETFEKENDHKTRIKVVGITKYLPEDIQKIIHDIEEKTSSHTGTQISLCVSYGGREEILDTIQNCKIPLSELTTSSFSEMLPLPDVDYVIRTSGEYRVSNFLMWQSAYAEYYFTETCWPDFSIDELDKALNDYTARNRRYGLEDSAKTAIIETDDIIESYKEMYETYDGSIQFLYEELLEKGYKWEQK
jgi:undecaprenyl diphosphate synthase